MSTNDSAFIAECRTKNSLETKHLIPKVEERLLDVEEQIQGWLDLQMKEERTLLASEQRHYDAASEKQGELKRLLIDMRAKSDAYMQYRNKTSLVGDDPGWTGSKFRGGVSVGSEESTYRPDTSTSFFRDVIFSRQDPAAFERLSRNQREAIETRDITTGDPGGGGFVPPIYLGNLWAELPRADRPFANVVPSRPLPDTGVSISIPKVQTGTAIASQASQNAAIQETDIDTESVTSSLVTIAGMNDVSLQAIERTFPGMDEIIYRDLLAAHDGELDRQLLAGSGSSGQHLGIRNVTGNIDVTYTDASPTAAELLPKVYDAIQQVASNRFRNANLIVMHPRRAAWLASNLSSTFPLFQQGTLTQAVGTQEGGFATSFGGLRVVLDPNVPTNLGTGTNEDEIYIMHADDALLFEGPTQFVRFDDVLSSTLTVRLRLHSFSFWVPHRQPKSIAVIAGTGLVAPSFT